MNRKLARKISKNSHTVVHVIFIGTKPEKQIALYRYNVSKKIVDYVFCRVNDDTGLFKTEEQRLGLLCK